MLALARRFRSLLRLPAPEFGAELDRQVLEFVAARANRGGEWEDRALRRSLRGGVHRIAALDEMLDRMVDERTWRLLWTTRFALDSDDTQSPSLSRAERGSVLYRLAKSYDFRLPRDRARARTLWRLAAEAGSAEAANMLGETLRDGLEDGLSWARPKHRREAVHWFRVGAESGDPSAMLNYGYRLFYGEGVRRDRKAALRWYWLAAGSRNREASSGAMGNLGHMYRRGEGVSQSWDTALRWYHRAARRGSVTAAHWLGRIYGGDEALPERPQLAIRWLGRAAKLGDRESRTSLGVYLHNGKHVRKDWVRAARLYRQSADEGEVWAKYLLGLCYRDGEGVRKNAGVARRLFRVAADAGTREARRALVAMGPARRASTRRARTG